MAIRGWGLGRVFGLLLALAVVLTGVFGTATITYHALTWDTFEGTVTRCDDADLKTPTCFASFTEGGRDHEVRLATSGATTPPVGDPVTLWVSPARNSADVAGWLPLLLGPTLLLLGLGFGIAVIFWPSVSRSLRKSELLWGRRALDNDH